MVCSINLTRFFFEEKLKKFLHIGSSAEYGNLKNSTCKESVICKPISTYGKKKLKITKHLKKIFKIKYFPLVIIRLFQVYGPNDKNDKIIPFILKNCLKNKKFSLTQGYQTRDFSHIDDVINAIISLLKTQKNKILGNIYNIGSGQSITIKDLVNIIRFKIKKGKPNFGAIKIKKDEIIFSKSSIRKIKNHINWSPKISLKNGIGNLILNEK